MPLARTIYVCVCLCVRAVKENGSSYQHQTWYTYTVWQSLGMRWPEDQKVKGQGHTVTKTVTVTWLLVKWATAAGVGLHVVWLLRFLVQTKKIMLSLLLLLLLCDVMSDVIVGSYKDACGTFALCWHLARLNTFPLLLVYDRVNGRRCVCWLADCLSVMADVLSTSHVIGCSKMTFLCPVGR